MGQYLQARIYPLPNYAAAFGKYPSIEFRMTATANPSEWVFVVTGRRNDGEEASCQYRTQAMMADLDQIERCADIVAWQLCLE